MRKCLPWGLILILCGCQPVEQELNPNWHVVNEIFWSSMADMPYPFLVHGEIGCDSYAGLKLAHFYPLNTGSDEDAVGVPLTADARMLMQKSDLKSNVGKVFKNGADLERLEREVLGICGF